MGIVLKVVFGLYLDVVIVTVIGVYYIALIKDVFLCLFELD